MTTKELIATEEENLKHFINEREQILREQIDAKSEIEFLEAKDLNNKNSNKVVTSANKNLLLSAASKKGYTKDVFESMLEKKYNCNLSNIDMITFNTVYTNLSKAQ